jgi:hypothetical protein
MTLIKECFKNSILSQNLKRLSTKFKFSLGKNSKEFTEESATGIKNVRNVILHNLQIFENIFGILEVHPCTSFFILKSLLKEEEEHIWNYFLTRKGSIKKIKNKATKSSTTMPCACYSWKMNLRMSYSSPNGKPTPNSSKFTALLLA